MKTKVLNLLLILSSFIGYLQWGTTNEMFLIQGEWEVIQKLISTPSEALHPFTVLPLLGQLLLLITLFQKQPNRALTIWGMAGIGILLIFISFIGMISLHYKTFLSTVPFIVVCVLTIQHLRKSRSK